MKKLFVLFVILAAIVSTANAQQMQNLYTLYGFYTPNLKSGEYVVSANVYNSYSETDNHDSPSDYESRYRYLNVNGTLAATDKIFIKMRLNYFPETLRSVSYASSDSKYERTSNGYLRPELGASFKPLKNLEFYANASIVSYRNTIEHSYYDSIIDDYVRENEKSDSRSHNFTVGVNYFGKLW